MDGYQLKQTCQSSRNPSKIQNLPLLIQIAVAKENYNLALSAKRERDA